MLIIIAKGSNSHAKGMTINDLGVGPKEIEKKKFFEGARPGKNKFHEALLWEK